MRGSGSGKCFCFGQILELVRLKKKKNYLMTNNTRNSIIYENNNKRCSMLNNRSTARIVPSWDTCIEALFDSHLPIKFAFTGRLSLHDITQDGFYVLRRNVCTYDILRIYRYFRFLIFFFFLI